MEQQDESTKIFNEEYRTEETQFEKSHLVQNYDRRNVMFSLQFSRRRRYPSLFILLGLCFFRLHAAKHHIKANYMEKKNARHLSEGGIPPAPVATKRLHSVRKRERRLSEHTSDGERPQENQYGGGQVPEENENEIDCSKFEHLDELPPFCRDYDDEGGEDEDELWEDGYFQSPVSTPTRQPTIQDSQPPAARPVRPPSLEEVSQGGMDEGVDFVENNVITLPISLGLFKPGELSESRARVLASLVTKVLRILLDRYTPYRVEPSSSDDDRFVISRGADRRHLESLVGRLLDQGSNGQQADLMRSGDAVETARSGYHGRPLVFLYMSGVNVWESPVWDNWLQFFVSYRVFWPNGSPVTNTRNLESIEFSCQEVLNTTIDVGKFWAEMLEQDEDARFVMREGVNWSERGMFTGTCFNLMGVSCISSLTPALTRVS